jgi:ubiquinone/menaquinone biosynthesis C-methylase UbiE
MDKLDENDVPYGNDWDCVADVEDWAKTANEKRPWRSQIQEHIADRVAALALGAQVLELGSGPGFLALRVLQRCPHLQRYVLLDFSEPMLALSRERLSAFPVACFVRASFKSDDWMRHLDGRFDCVVSMQAVHELRHKRHARRLYEQVYGVLTIPGLVMISEHTPADDSPRSVALNMTESEQQQALREGGFSNVRVELSINRLILCAGEK